MTAQTVEDMVLEDRARALVCWATRYDEVFTTLTTGGHGFLTPQMAEDSLIGAFSLIAHPLLSADRAGLAELIRDLRDACHNRDEYDTYGYLPDHLSDKWGDRPFTDDEVRAALDEDVDMALFPLLTATSTANACRECVRLRCDVTNWKVATDGARCQDHPLPTLAVIR